MLYFFTYENAGDGFLQFRSDKAKAKKMVLYEAVQPQTHYHINLTPKPHWQQVSDNGSDRSDWK